MSHSTAGEIIWDPVPGAVTAMRAHAVFCLTGLVVLPLMTLPVVRGLLHKWQVPWASAPISTTTISVAALFLGALSLLWLTTLLLPRARWAWFLGWATIVTSSIALLYTIPFTLLLSYYWSRPVVRRWLDGAAT